MNNFFVSPEIYLVVHSLPIYIHPSESSIAVLHVETIQQQQTVIVISRDDQVFTTRSCFLCLCSLYTLLLPTGTTLREQKTFHCYTENDFPT